MRRGKEVIHNMQAFFGSEELVEVPGLKAQEESEFRE